MPSFDDQLKQALKRSEPSGDFSARVLARCAEPKRSALWNWRLAAVAATLVALSSLVAYRHYEYEVRGEAAKQQLLVAFRIAGQKLQSAQERVNEVTVQ
jgi:hypothetical protein